MFAGILPLYCIGNALLISCSHYTYGPCCKGPDLHQYVTQMTPDLNLPPITTNPIRSGPSSLSGATAPIPLELLRPIAAELLAPGESVRAEVLSSSAKSGQFELLLRLATDRAEASNVTVLSRQPIEPGTQLTARAISPTQLLALLAEAMPPTATQPPLTRLGPQTFPQGSLIQARVISSQPAPTGIDQARFAVVAKILQGAGAGSLLSLDSARPVAVGSLLSAEVSNQGTLRVIPGNEQSRQLDLLQGLRTTLQAQASAEPMLRQLDQLAGQRSHPPLLQAVMHQVLNHVATPEQLSTTAGITQAIRQSGNFLEANLLQLNQALQATAGASTGSASKSDLTALPTSQQLPPLERLLPLLSSLSTPPGVEPLPGADFKASLLSLLITLQQQLPPDAARTATFPPDPWQAQLTAKPGLFPLPSRAVQALAEAPDLGSLLRLTAALLARIQHHQFQGLGQTQTLSDGTTQTVWQLEIPLRDGQQFTQVQLRIQREQEAPDRNQSEQQPQWEIRLAFNLEQLGPLQAITRLYKGRVSSEFWAEQHHTLQLVSEQLDHLRDRLLTKGLDVGDLSCHRGSPPEPHRAVQQRWIDEVT